MMIEALKVEALALSWEGEGMRVENYSRAVVRESVAYTEQAFKNIANRLYQISQEIAQRAQQEAA